MLVELDAVSILARFKFQIISEGSTVILSALREAAFSPASYQMSLPFFYSAPVIFFLIISAVLSSVF